MKNKHFDDLLDDNESTPTTTSESGTSILDYSQRVRVPNTHPTITNQPYRIAVVGEAPGTDEVIALTPFVGYSGKFLTGWLSKANILRDACFIGNICQIQPPGNKIELFSRTGVEITEGFSRLENDLNIFNPNICLLLGKSALWAAKGTDAIGDWRGSLFISDRPGPFFGRKCIATYHPAACLRQYEFTPLLFFDIKKCKDNATTKDLIPVHENFELYSTTDRLIERLRQVKYSREKIALDIEGYVNAMSCLSIAVSASDAFIIPLASRGNSNFYPTVEEEVQVWQALASILCDPLIPKVLQNSLYDRFVLQYSYNITVRGVVDDTMLKHAELYCELEKSLAFQASIYTNRPYYKGERKSDDQETFWRYCCRDSAITWEINEKLDKFLDAGQKKHYAFNMMLLNPLLYMELRGFNYNKKLAEERLKQVYENIYSLQYQLDEIAGFGVKVDQNTTCAQVVRDLMCFKKDGITVKANFQTTFPRANSLASLSVLTNSELGELSTLCEKSLNIKSKDFKIYLYETLGLPKQYNEKDGVKTLTTDYVALIKLRKHSDHPSLQLAIDIGELRTRAQTLESTVDLDGRMRCGYNIVGTETVRLSCYASPTGSGFNLQTVADTNTLKSVGHPLHLGMRDLFRADSECYLAQCDLKGADGWTIGAHLNSLGDPSMLLDLQAGIKPAARICYMLRHGLHSLQGRPRAEVKDLLKEVKSDDWDYFGCKQGIWGLCYLMGPDLLATVIAKQSEGKVWMSRTEVGKFRDAVFTAYRIRTLHDAVERRLSVKPETQTFTGHRRRFFARKSDQLGQALAHEPQFFTTYATNLAMYRLWTDRENRICLEGRQSLRCEPIHQVHDALITQFKTSDTTWASDKIKQWFNNQIIIAGQVLTVPFDGKYGTSWGTLKEGVI